MPVTRTPKVTDTSRDAQKVLLELLRAAPPGASYEWLTT